MYTTICSSIYLLKEIWLVFSFGLWTFEYKIFYRHTLSFLSGRYLRVEWLDHMVKCILTFWGIDRMFSEVVVPFYISIAMYSIWIPFPPHSHQHLLWLVFLILAIIAMTVCLIAALHRMMPWKAIMEIISKNK